jgi:hypothetical protein
MTERRLLLASLVFVSAFVAASAGQVVYQDTLPIAHPKIQYFGSHLDDPVARLAGQLERGTVTLDYRQDGNGYLASLLQRLGINTDSQALVFSKTSFQAARISPRNPRAIYFADDVAVGFVHGGDVIELAALDPRQGVIFYTLNTQASAKPALARRDVCLRCHNGPATAGVPGMFVSSVFPSPSGTPETAGAIVTDHRTAFQDRWGGWYVNGRHGASRHRGNAVAPNPAEPEVLERAGTQNLADLTGRVNTSGYLSPVSDIVALLTFEHQTQMTNLLTRLGWEARIGERDLKPDIENLVSYMLFADEAPLTDPVQGVSSFSKTFPERGPRERRGRSLRDFDLRTRLFRYPLSYMIYDPAFDALPDAVRDAVYRRLHDVLTGAPAGPRFRALNAGDRRAIVEILRETKPALPEYFRPPEGGRYKDKGGRYER